jgi:hypothetical protein
MTKNDLEDFLALELEERSFEDILADYDLSPSEVFVLLYDNGLIDDEILEGRVSVDFTDED